MLKPIKCRHCKELIIDEDDLLLGNISNNPSKTIKGKFHKSKDCYEHYLKDKKDKKEYKERIKMSKEEKEDWNNLYDYVRYEILEYKKGMKLSPYIRGKLQGLRTGDFTVKKGDIINECKGYPYKIILMTFQVMKLLISTSVRNKTFNNDNHKFNYILKIILNNINDVYRKYEEKQNEKNNLENIKIDVPMENENIEYKNKTSLKDNKVANLLKDLF
ncbi:hypothetical protein K144316041_p21090 (plasmid) [Clostridium tetani]|uniref:hypothetical protein n=1 Tax=Clostridium tetani TaxID=1513 RepID=UPI0029553738|nr:hypothetical protein [Clostridium tetani]BDR74270.1 hypothetical protein K144316041_p21090 [Clostridium tetani]